MANSLVFYKAIADSLPDQMVVIDQEGTIVYCNQAWYQFGSLNGMPATTRYIGMNYLQACRQTKGKQKRQAMQTAEGIESVITGESNQFSTEYPCHSPDQYRWFSMIATPLVWEGPSRYMIVHHDISDRKLIEEKVRKLSFQDGLTNIANRRYFDQFLKKEWRREQRYSHPLSLMMIDIDHFKDYNDHYGHQQGDYCLQKVAKQLARRFSKRPGDLCARYGGEEFCIILANTSLEQAAEMAEKIRRAVAKMKVPHEQSTVSDYVTVSIGVASVIPKRQCQPKQLVEAADQALYAAKENGRNRFELNTDLLISRQ